MDSEELTHAQARVMCVSLANVSTELATGVASLWRTAAGDHLITCGDKFIMPLCGQPVLRVDHGVFVFPCPPGGDVKNYVLLLRVDKVGDEEAVGVFEAILVTHTQVRSSSEGGGSSSGAAATAASSSAAAPSTSVVPAAAAAATAAAAGAGAGAAAFSFAALRAQLPPAEDVGSSLSKGIVFMGNGMRSALVAGATLTGMGVSAGMQAIGKAVGPAQQPLKLSETTATRLNQARLVTKSAAVLTGAMVEGAAVMARSLGGAAAHALAESETGKKLLAQSSTPTGTAVKAVGSASLQAFKTVWDGLEEAAVIVGKASAGATREFMHTRYGDSGDAPTESALALASDVGAVALHARNLGVGGMIRKAACETAAQTIAIADGTAGLARAPPQPALGGSAAMGLAMAAAAAAAAQPGAGAGAGAGAGVAGLVQANPGLASAAMQHAMANPQLAVQAMQFAAANPQAAQAALQMAGSMAQASLRK